jgi:hypothetical protein
MQIGTSMTVQNANLHILPYLGIDFRKQDHIKETRVVLKTEQKTKKELPRQEARENPDSSLGQTEIFLTPRQPPLK